MIFALLSSILGAFADVFRKKTLIYNVPALLNTFFGYSMGLIFTICFLFISDLSKVDLLLIIVFTFTSIIDIVKSSLSNSIYKEEKISTLIPYTNLNKVLTIIASFFFFSDVTLTSLFITILVIFVIIGFSIDFKTLKFPRNIMKMFLHQFLSTITSLIIGYFVISYSAYLVFMAHFATGMIILIFICGFYGMFGYFKTLDKNFYVQRLGGASLLGWGGYAVSLLIISELGLSISILLSFIGIGIRLLFGYFMLNDTPSKKDLLLTIVVSLLVGLGYLYK